MPGYTRIGRMRAGCQRSQAVAGAVTEAVTGAVAGAVFFVSFGHSKSFVLLTQAKRGPRQCAVTVTVTVGIVLVMPIRSPSQTPPHPLDRYAPAY